jgi:hypothetical protein
VSQVAVNAQSASNSRCLALECRGEPQAGQGPEM